MTDELAVHPTNVLALCSGYGGIELGLRLALGERVRTVCHVEREAYAAAVLVARMGDATLDQAPVWADVVSFDGKPWRGVVDLVTAGFPCQPVSIIGKGRAQDDERWLWPHIARIVGEVGPRYVFVENVPAILTAGKGSAFGEVLGSLADLGFDAEWDRFSAAEIGSSHRRERIFLLAYAPRVDDSRPVARGNRGRQSQAKVGDGSRYLGHGDERAKRKGDIVADGLRFEPSVRRVADGPSDRVDEHIFENRVDRLRALGNGVQPQTAAFAFSILMERVMASLETE